MFDPDPTLTFHSSCAEDDFDYDDDIEDDDYEDFDDLDDEDEEESAI